MFIDDNVTTSSSRKRYHKDEVIFTFVAKNFTVSLYLITNNFFYKHGNGIKMTLKRFYHLALMCLYCSEYV